MFQPVRALWGVDTPAAACVSTVVVANLEAVKPEPKARRKRPRSPTIFTLDVVKSIADDVAHGLTYAQACDARDLKLKCLEKALSRRPELRRVMKKGQAIFLQSATRTIAAGKEWYGLAWILERRHGDQFRLPRESHAVTVTQQNLGVTISAEALADIRRIAKEQAINGLPVTSKPTITTGER